MRTGGPPRNKAPVLATNLLHRQPQAGDPMSLAPLTTLVICRLCSRELRWQLRAALNVIGDRVTELTCADGEPLPLLLTRSQAHLGLAVSTLARPVEGRDGDRRELPLGLEPPY